jgi:hypothetical protein
MITLYTHAPSCGSLHINRSDQEVEEVTLRWDRNIENGDSLRRLTRVGRVLKKGE